MTSYTCIHKIPEMGHRFAFDYEFQRGNRKLNILFEARVEQEIKLLCA